MKKNIVFFTLLVFVLTSKLHGMDEVPSWAIDAIQNPDVTSSEKTAAAYKLYAIKELKEFPTTCKSLAEIPQFYFEHYTLINNISKVLSRLFDGALLKHFENDNSATLSNLLNTALPKEASLEVVVKTVETDAELQRYMRTFLRKKADALSNAFNDLSERIITKDDLEDICMLNATGKSMLPISEFKSE